MEYDPQNNYDGNYYPEQDEYGDGQDNTVKGLKITIGILVAVLIVLAFLFWNKVRLDSRDAEMMKIEMDTLQSQLGAVKMDFESMKSDNDSLNRDLAMQSAKADSLLTALKKEKSYRYSIVKRYEKEIGSLRSIMQGYVHQIDSLNKVNQKLAGENIKYRKEIANYKTKAESYEEKASELQTQMNRASIVRARGITMKMLKKNDKQATSVKQARKLEVNFTLSANEVAQPGMRTVYVSVINPKGAVISSAGRTVEIDSQAMPYTDSRQVDYTGEDLNVSVYCQGESFEVGKYTIVVYMDGTTIGSAQTNIKK